MPASTSSEVTGKERELVRRLLLGWGAVAEEIFPGEDLGRDIALVRNEQGRLDLALVQGLDNLGQALTLALTTRLGDDLFNVTFGFDGLNALVEESNPLLVRERVRIAVIRTLVQDPRVRRIVDVKLGREGQLEPVPAGSRTLDVRVAFETISADNLTVEFGNVAGFGRVGPNV